TAIAPWLRAHASIETPPVPLARVPSLVSRASGLDPRPCAVRAAVAVVGDREVAVPGTRPTPARDDLLVRAVGDDLDDRLLHVPMLALGDSRGRSVGRVDEPVARHVLAARAIARGPGQGRGCAARLPRIWARGRGAGAGCALAELAAVAATQVDPVA